MKQQNLFTVIFIAVFLLLNFILPILHVYYLFSQTFYLDFPVSEVTIPPTVFSSILAVWNNFFFILVPLLWLILIIDPLFKLFDLPFRIVDSFKIQKYRKLFYRSIFILIIVLSIGQYILFLLMIFSTLTNPEVNPLGFLLFIIGWVFLTVGYLLFYKNNQYEVFQASNNFFIEKD